MTPNSPQALTIRSLNDGFRTTFIGRQVMISAGVQARGPEFVRKAALAVRDFESFDETNDPHGEHDFGTFVVDDQKLFWKIVYYDRALEAGSPDPANPALTTRVLTILLPLEW